MRTKFRHQRLNTRSSARWSPARHSCGDLVDRGADKGRSIRRAGCGHQQARVARCHRRLAAVEQFLEQLLAGAQAGVLDRHVPVGPQPRQADHLACQIDDPHRLTHVEDENATQQVGIGQARQMRLTVTPTTVACSTKPTASRTVMK